MDDYTKYKKFTKSELIEMLLVKSNDICELRNRNIQCAVELESVIIDRDFYRKIIEKWLK